MAKIKYVTKIGMKIFVILILTSVAILLIAQV